MSKRTRITLIIVAVIVALCGIGVVCSQITPGLPGGQQQEQPDGDCDAGDLRESKPDPDCNGLWFGTPAPAASKTKAATTKRR